MMNILRIKTKLLATSFIQVLLISILTSTIACAHIGHDPHITHYLFYSIASLIGLTLIMVTVRVYIAFKKDNK